jgi:flagellar hook-length control protein FliK
LSEILPETLPEIKKTEETKIEGTGQPRSQQLENSDTQKSAELIVLLPFFFKIAQEQEKFSSVPHQSASSKFTALNTEVLKEIFDKGFLDENKLVEVASKLNDELKKEFQLAQGLDKNTIQDFAQVTTEQKVQIPKWIEDGLNKIQNNVQSRIQNHIQNNIQNTKQNEVYDLAFKQMQKSVKEETKTETKTEMKTGIKTENLSEVGVLDKEVVRNSSKDFESGIVKADNTKGLNAGNGGEKFLQAYFNTQRMFQAPSSSYFVTASKEKLQAFHRVHLNEFAAFVRDFSIELMPRGEKMARLSLEPPELGRLELEVKVKDKKVEIVAKVEKPEAFHEIRQHLHQIKTHFEEAGLQLKDFQLSLAENLAGGGEFFTEKKGEGKSSDKEKRQRPVELGSIENEVVDNIPLINNKGSYYYIV